MLTATPFLWLLQELLQNKRVRECEHHGDHDADTDTSANRAHADDETRCQCDVTEDVFHLIAPMDDEKK